MPVRPVEGAALLVAGHGAPGVRSFDASAVHTLGQIGEALYATGLPWHVRRLTATTGERFAADRRTIKRSLNDLIHDPVRVAVLVLLGEIVEVAGELALVTGSEAYDYPEDATLPLSWIRDRLRQCKAEHLVVAMSARGSGDPARWLGALGTERTGHVVAVDAPTDGNPMVDALLAGLCGDALDRQTGTVTLASLSQHLASFATAVQGSDSGETVAQPPPLAGLWDVRRSQLSRRPRPERSPGQPEDLTGTVLPGRFRLDTLVARGTFGTVYRARQLAVERDVAVKVLHADIDPSSGDGKLFVHEIRAVGRIDHPNVVRIHQADITHDGRLFFAMELLDGEDLQKLGADKLPPQRALELVLPLLAGLGAAHATGLFHADIKPANAIVVPPRARNPLDPDSEKTPERVVLADFGLARLRSTDRPTESAGGTPAYMAPEQLALGRVDARSDLFSVALVLLWLITGWRRRDARTLVPSTDVLDGIDDPDLRTVLRRALDRDPAKRFHSARDFADALAGGSVPAAESITPPPQQPPFHQLASLTEADRGRLQGREADVALITEYALYRRCVAYAAPSGTGKTSVLRAGLLPRLEALGIRAIYIPCRTEFAAAVINEIAPGAASIAEAIASFHEHRGGKLVIVVDQLEIALADTEFVRSLLDFTRWPAGADVSVVLAVREDYLARLLTHTQDLEPIPIVRLPPLSVAGARAAIVAPLAEHRLEIEPALLENLLADLQRAAGSLGPEMGWGSDPAVYPPHLQLACSVLYENLRPDDAGTLTLASYRRLGGFEAIVGEHLDRVIENELSADRASVARDLFLALVISNQRAIRTEAELLDVVGGKHGTAEVEAVLEVLRRHGLLVRIRRDAGASWELVHDSLVARVRSWIDRKDLARRRAIENVRYHLRRSSPKTPSLLGRKELRELAAHDGALEELDREWTRREGPDEVGWTPSRLVSRSRQVRVRTVATYSSILTLALAVAAFGLYRSQVQEARAAEQEHLKGLDLGRFTLALDLFDWDPVTLDATRVAPVLGQLSWKLHASDRDDPEQVGPPFDPSWIVHGDSRIEEGALVETVEAHGGPAYLVVTRGPCPPATIPFKRLPGYTERDEAPPTLRIRVPTCRASAADMIAIPAGPFLYGGVGNPPSSVQQEEIAQNPGEVERRVDLPAFAIDRTEVTNAAFRVFAAMSRTTGIEMPEVPETHYFERTSGPRKPVAGVTWTVARDYCRFVGKRLPTSEQWVKAMRGGERIDEAPNPFPRRNLPWGTSIVGKSVAVGLDGTPDVGTHPDDVSPYGVLDLAGGVMEWTATSETPNTKIVRGGNWGETTMASLVDYMAIPNQRVASYAFLIGMRCVMPREAVEAAPSNR